MDVLEDDGAGGAPGASGQAPLDRLDGDSCTDSSDCESGVCDADICLAPTREDNSFNQDETDVDGGGSTACPRTACTRSGTASARAS